MTTPAYSGTIDISKQEVEHIKLLVGIDIGVSLTKVVFLHKDNEKQLLEVGLDNVTFQYALFDNKHFEDAMKWIRQQAFLPRNALFPVHITGSGGYDKIDVVESILGLKCEYKDETVCTIKGLRTGLTKIGFQNLVAPPVNVETFGKMESKMMDRLYDGLKTKMLKEISLKGVSDSLYYPCLIHICGSQSKFVYFDKEGKGELIKCQSIGGQIFLGLGKCLLDTNNFDELTNLAAKGNCANVDTQTKDILSDSKNSPYGIYPPEMPLLPFGKSMDFNTGLEDYAKEDVAASLVSLCSILILMEYFHMCKNKSISKVYLTGNIFRCNVFLKAMRRFLLILPNFYEMEMLDFGYARSLGAMFYSGEDTDE